METYEFLTKDGKIISDECVTGYSQYMAGGRMVKRVRPSFAGLKAHFPTLSAVKFGERVKGSPIYFMSLILVTDEGEIEITAKNQVCNTHPYGVFPVFCELPYLRIDLAQVIKRKGKKPALKAPVRIGSVIKIDEGTLVGNCNLNCRFHWTPKWDHRKPADRDMIIYVIRESEGKLINEDGTLSDEVVNFKSHIGTEYPTGYGNVTCNDGLTVLHKGGQSISYGIRDCM